MMWIVILGEDKTKKGETLKDQRFSLWVGLAGFEPAASSSRTKRATKLRYSPFCNSWKYYIMVLDKATRHVVLNRRLCVH